MAWESLKTTIGMLGFVGVVGYGVYTYMPSKGVERADRLCSPIRDVRDATLGLFSVSDREVKGKVDLFLRLDDYIHSDVCARYAVRFLFGKDVSNLYMAKDYFRESLYKKGLMLDEIDLVMETGEKTGVFWEDEAETNVLLQEYFEYRSLQGGG